MKTTPMIFTADSIRAMLDERKTQTRRVVKPQPIGSEVYPPESSAPRQAFQWMPTGSAQVEDIDCRLCPYGEPGDLIWCKEGFAGNWGFALREDAKPITSAAVRQENGDISYATDNDPVWVYYRAESTIEPAPHIRWHSPIFCPRWASRLTLRLTDVRVERVQEISEPDMDAEGLDVPPGPPTPPWHLPELRERHYKNVWNAINAKRGYPWDDNPWVWALTYDVIHANVDDVLAEPQRFAEDLA